MTVHLIICSNEALINGAYYMKRFAALRKIAVDADPSEHILAGLTVFLELPRLYRPYYDTS